MSNFPFGDPNKVLIVAFEGWNDAGDSATTAAQTLLDQTAHTVLSQISSDEYFDFQLTRPLVELAPDGSRVLNWPDVKLFGPEAGDFNTPMILLGQEPSRLWTSFSSNMVELALAYGIETIIFLGAILSDVPHSRPVEVTVTSDDSMLRERLDLEKSAYEGPVGALTVFSLASAEAGIPCIHLWAHVPHYIHTSPSPKATLALLEKLQELTGITSDINHLEAEARRWEEGIDALAAEDADMSAYIDQLEQARDAADAPEASGDAIASEFQKYLRKWPDRPGPSEL